MRRLGLFPARNDATHCVERRHSEQHNRGLSFAARCMSTTAILTVLAATTINHARALPGGDACPVGPDITYYDCITVNGEPGTQACTNGHLSQCRPKKDPPPVFDSVSLQGMEVTQAIQDMGNSVPLIAGKTTWVRVYLAKTKGSRAVTAKLQATLDGSVVATVSPVANITVAAGDSLKTRRTNWGKSLNFPLPASVTASRTVTFRLISVAAADSLPSPISCDDTCTQTQRVTFVEGPPLVVRAVGLTYRFRPTPTAPEQTISPRPMDYALLKSWLARAYPTPSVNFSETTMPVNFTSSFTSNNANAQPASLRASEMSADFPPLPSERIITASSMTGATPRIVCEAAARISPRNPLRGPSPRGRLG
jgi:hypothetical protein